MRGKKTYWRINEYIHAPEVRVLDEKGEQVGLMPVSLALKKAQEAGVDLVEIAPKARPPVVKIIDFGKFRYQEEKKQRKARSKASELKEIRFSPFIGEADYQTRLERIREFLGEKNKVRVVVKFKGRQMRSKDFGYGLCQRVLKDLDHQINIDMEPKFLGRHLAMVISPTSKPRKEEPKEEKKN